MLPCLLSNKHIQLGHKMDWEDVQILGHSPVDIRRKIKEVICIRRHRPALNRDGGYDLPPSTTTCCHVAESVT